MKRYLVCLAFLTGCMPPQITFPMGPAALVYADAKALHARIEVRLTDACKAGKLDAETCKELAAANLELKITDAVIREQLSKPETPVDWQKVIEYLGKALALAGKVL